MSMKGVYLSFDLGFSNEQDREDSESILIRLLGLNAMLNLQYLHKNQNAPSLYDSGIVYTPPDQADGRPKWSWWDKRKLLDLMKKNGTDPETAMMVIKILYGMEIFLDVPALLRRGKGDCNELVPYRVAELWKAGVAASPYLVKGGSTAGGGIAYHAVVLWPDQSIEDVSLILGMGGPDRADEREEEMRKNAERWKNFADAGVDPSQFGLFPSDGVFRSPYKKTG